MQIYLSSRENTHITTLLGAGKFRAKAYIQEISTGEVGAHEVRILEVIGFSTLVKGAGSTISNQENRTNDLYDHLVFQSIIETAELLGPLEVLEVRNVAS